MTDNVFSGNFSGNNYQFGENSTQYNNSTISSNNLKEIVSLLESLRSEIQQSQIPPAAKASLSQHVAEMAQATQSSDPKQGLSHTLEAIDKNLQQVGSVTDHVSGIAGKLAKIGSLAGIAFKTVAPFLAHLL